MRPRTISASSLIVADGCLARYFAENIQFVGGPDEKQAANLGTACHYALEKYVETVHMQKSMPASVELLLAYYDAGFKICFPQPELIGGDLYNDGVEMLKKWFKRTDFTGRTVISVEKKTRYPIPSSQGDIPFTYIWDRCDVYEENGRKIVEIVDYKTIRGYVSPTDLYNKLQARVYGLFARVQFKDQGVDEFRVTFDLLRFEPVTAVFSAEDDAATWTGIKQRLERILATPTERIPETLNADCGYCVRKQSCSALRANVEAGGFFSIDNIREATRKRYEMAAQAKALEATITELDTFIMRYAEEEELVDFQEDGYQVKIGARRSRTIDPRLAARILGDKLFRKYGKIGVTEVDKIIKGDEIPEDKKAELLSAIGYSVGKATVSIKKIS